MQRTNMFYVMLYFYWMLRYLSSRAIITIIFLFISKNAGNLKTKVFIKIHQSLIPLSYCWQIFFAFTSKCRWLVEYISYDHQGDTGKQHANHGSRDHIHRMVEIVADSCQWYPEGKNYQAKLDKGSGNLQWSHTGLNSHMWWFGKP